MKSVDGMPTLHCFGGKIFPWLKKCKKAILSALLATGMVFPGVYAGEADSQGEAQFLKNIRQLIYEGERSGEGYFSPEGNFLIFQSEREPGNPFFQIYILSFESGETQRVSPGTGKTTCSFFRPGSDEVLFASTHLDPDARAKQQAEYEFRASGKQRRYSWDYDEYMDIFSARRDGSALKRLTGSRGYDAEGAYSPDGSKIVFCSMRNAYPEENLSPEDRQRLQVDPAYFGELYIMNADGSDQKRLTNWAGYDGGPFFSPDGRRIIWRHFEENGMRADVYTMNLDGSDIQRVTDFEAMSWAPYFHPSGEYIIFTSNKLGFSNFELSIVDVRGEKEPLRVTYTDGFDGLPVFSPDGRRLAWTTNRTPDKASQIFIAEWNHEAALEALKTAPPRQSTAPSRSSAITPSPKVSTASAGLVSGTNGHSPASYSPEIKAADMRAHVEYLASDALEGRMTGGSGIRKAGQYTANYFQEIGLKPLGENQTYFQEFPFTSGVKVVPEQNHLAVIQTTGSAETRTFKLDEDFRPLGFTSTGEVEGEVVFAGYGLTVPGSPEEGYDSYAGLDVKDKIVLVLRYAPEDVDMERRQVLNHYAGLRYKALLARENGARALLVVSGANSPNAGELVPLSFDRGSGDSGIPVTSITGAVAEALFAGSGKSLKEVQSELDLENPHFEGTFSLPGIKVQLSAAVQREKSSDKNVLALLPAAGGLDNPQYLILGAHYDHIGFGEIGSLARKGEEGQIHNGADDNASGTALVMEIAGALAEARRNNPQAFRHGVIFALWSGEELGIVGSSHFAENPTVPAEQILAYLNFDMVGRLRDNTLILQGVASSNVWKKMIEKRNVMAGFNLKLQDDPYLPTDATAFYPKGIPVLSFFTGSHEDYNRPTDDPETLNYEGMERIANFARALASDLVNLEERPDYVKVERSKQDTGGRAALRAYLGTIPDYATEDVEGVKLSGVRAGGPADRAGLRGGDVIVEFAGQKITNIYDYTYALDAIKIGEPVEIVVLRDRERKSLTIIPEARK